MKILLLNDLKNKPFLTGKFQTKVHTNVYGLARSFLALSLILNLIFNESYIHFYNPQRLNSAFLGIPNFFGLFGEEGLSGMTILACGFLLLVIIGYLPQLTGIIHAWIAFSFFAGASFVEGGDQLAQIITFILIPVTLSDKRLNHWNQSEFFKYKHPYLLEFFNYSSVFIIKFQMAMVYFFAVAVKLNTDFWKDGTAIYYWFGHKPFGAPDYLYNSFHTIVSNTYIAPILTWGVLTLEALLFCAFFMDQTYKKLFLVMGVTFHLLIGIFHGLWSFYFVMVGGLILYLLPSNRNLLLPFNSKDSLVNTSH